MSKRIVLTGVSKGLGRSLVEQFSMDGHRIAGIARSSSAIAELTASCGPEHLFRSVDVTDDQALSNWADEVLERFGPPDLLINNAATINRNAPLWEVPLDEFEQVVDINITGVFRVIRHFLPAMITESNGVIVNLSSGWGRSVAPEVAPYCASKWGIEGMTQALAADLPAGLAAVALNPGVINTDLLQSCFGPSASSYQSASEWARTAAPFLTALDVSDNGKSLTAP